MNLENALFDIAREQQGYFTTKQAKRVGYASSQLTRRIESGTFIKAGRGIYRLRNYVQYLPYYPVLVPLALWSCNSREEIQGTFSHYTACRIHGLLNDFSLNSCEIMTVPAAFRVHKETPKSLDIRHADLEPSERQWKQGYYVTTVVRTLYDMIEEYALCDGEKVEGLIKNALKENLIGAPEAISLFTYYGEHIEEKS